LFWLLVLIAMKHALTMIDERNEMTDLSNDPTLIDLLEKIAQRDHAALRALYDLTSGRLYGLALRIVIKSEWAEDVLQDAFIGVWRNAQDYRYSLSPPMAWLGMLVRSRALDLLRRQKSQRDESKTIELDADMSDFLEGESTDPLRDAIMSQEAFLLKQCLSRLETKQRQVISLAYLRDLSHSDLATSLGLPLGTVKTWIRRGLQQLRVCMSNVT
jgi:RNA polymerase sigma factor (sigma-70 family)